MKTILITGASSGFGKLAAKQLIKKGYTVYGAARRIGQMQDLVDLGGHAIEMDVTNDESVKEGVAQITKDQGKIDVLINNAGYAQYGIVETTDLEHAKRQYEVNVFGLVRVSQAVLPHMRKQMSGQIINLSSVAGKVSFPMAGWYASSKYAVEAISDAMRAEVKGFGIKVVIVEPGTFKTGFDDVAVDELEKLANDKVYGDKIKSFKNRFSEMYQKAPTPEPVINVLEKAITSKKPKTRYKVGMDSKMAIMMKGLLSDKAFDNVMLNQFGLK